MTTMPESEGSIHEEAEKKEEYPQHATSNATAIPKQDETEASVDLTYGDGDQDIHGLKTFRYRVKSKNIPTEDELVQLGNKLSESKNGGYIKIDSTTSSGTVFYSSAPIDPTFCSVHEGMIIMQSPKLLRNLCEAVSSSSGLQTQWNCNTKDKRRLNAPCTYSGKAAKNQSAGVRNKISRKVDCSAYVTTVSLDRLAKEFTNEDIKNNLYVALANLTRAPNEHVEFCVVNAVCLAHSGRTPEEISGKKLFLPRSADVIAHPKLKSSLEPFYRGCPPGYGSAMRVSRCLSIMYPQIEIPYETIRNMVAKIQDDEHDADKWVSFLKAQKENGEVEYLNVLLDGETGILKSITWSYKGSFGLAQRCGDLCSGIQHKILRVCIQTLDVYSS